VIVRNCISVKKMVSQAPKEKSTTYLNRRAFFRKEGGPGRTGKRKTCGEKGPGRVGEENP